MKSVLAIISSLLVAGVSSQYGYGGSTTTCSQQPVEFSVSGFRTSCIPHGTGCTFKFTVSTNETFGDVVCSADFSSAAETLPVVPWTTCSDKEIVWGFAPIGLPNETASNYTLILTQSSVGFVAAKFWGAADFPIIDDGSTVHQIYSGPTTFNV